MNAIALFVFSPLTELGTAAKSMINDASRSLRDVRLNKVPKILTTIGYVALRRGAAYTKQGDFWEIVAPDRPMYSIILEVELNRLRASA